MKRRDGFVSNSSSSSFVIKWKSDFDLDESLDRLFGIFNCIFENDTEEEKVDKLKKFNKERDRLYIPEIKDSTKIINDVFVTNCFITMRNDINDYPLWIKNLLFAIIENEHNGMSQFEIVGIEVDQD